MFKLPIIKENKRYRSATRGQRYEELTQTNLDETKDAISVSFSLL